VACRATIDDPEFKEFVAKMEEMRPVPPVLRDKLEKAMALIDEANSKDPSRVTWEGEKVPYRLLYSQWLTEWVQKMDPKASDELLLLARGRNVEGWRLSEIKRDDYAPNTAGVRQWEMDRRKWQAGRLVSIMKDAGYSEASCKLVEDVMADKGIPDPRDIRVYDLVGPLGMINYRLLEQASMVQTLRDADALVFMERSFPQMVAALEADKVLEQLKRELARVSNKCMARILNMQWTPVQKKLIAKALPSPRRFGDVLKEIEGVAAASTHPGDWRYRNFDYE